MILSKTNYIKGLSCQRYLWLNSREIFTYDKSGIVYETARKLFPNGTLVDFEQNNFDKMVKKTKELIDSDCDTIYEATFLKDNLFGISNIIVRNGEGWDIYEIKSTTKLRDEYIEDLSFLYHLLNQFIKIKRLSVIYINSKYRRFNKIVPNKLFNITDVTTRVLDNREKSIKKIEELKNLLNQDEPNVEIGSYCNSFECKFREYCWRDIPKNSIFDLGNFRNKFDFYYDTKITKIDEIPNDYKISENVRIQIDSYINNREIIEMDKIKEFIENISYPISFFDFETFADPIPRFDNLNPYTKVPFQYSLHILYNKDDKELKHYEYLGDGVNDPRREIALKMLKDIPKEGSIIAYHKSFEIKVIEKLAKNFGDLSEELIALTHRFVDLEVPFSKRWYYHPKFLGKSSIKVVLPTLFPNDKELSYKSLNIQNGGVAMEIYANLINIEDEKEKRKIFDDLLKYCYLDTLAMVKIFQKLNDIIRD